MRTCFVDKEKAVEEEKQNIHNETHQNETMAEKKTKNRCVCTKCLSYTHSCQKLTDGATRWLHQLPERQPSFSCNTLDHRLGLRSSNTQKSSCLCTRQHHTTVLRGMAQRRQDKLGYVSQANTTTITPLMSLVPLTSSVTKLMQVHICLHTAQISSYNINNLTKMISRYQLL